MRYLLITILLVQIGCSLSAQQITEDYQQEKAERRLFQKSPAVLKSPKEYLKRETDDGKEYDPKPRVVEIDKNGGKYEFQWIGYDGKKKVIAYQRADAMDAVVEAKVEKNPDKRFVYKYLIKNLPSSPTYFSSFTVQVFANDVIPTKAEDIHNGTMADFISEFKVGQWPRFAVLGETTPRIDPGKSVEFSLTSSELPGIVLCRATAGESTLKGVGEHMPSELERELLGYKEWAKGYTIGPVDRLATLNDSERAQYILENLPKFQEAGWISSGTARKYEAILKNQDLKLAFSEAKKDLENEFMTSEVFHIIEGLNK